MEVNHARADEAARRRLCGHVRLLHCSRAYQCWILPALAARHERSRSHNSCHTTAASPSPSPNSPTAAEPSLNRPPDDGWFPITTEDATCLNTYASATEAERKALTSGGTLGMCQPMRRWPPAWLSTPPRRQCLPDSGGRAFAFSAGLQQLEEAFGGIKPGAVGELYPRVCGTPCGCVKAQGLVWGPELQCAPALVGSAAAPAAGCFVFTQVPDVFRGLLLQPAPGAGGGCSSNSSGCGCSSSAGSGGHKLVNTGATAFPRLRVSVYGAGGEVRVVSCNEQEYAPFGTGRGQPRCLPLRDAATEAELLGWRGNSSSNSSGAQQLLGSSSSTVGGSSRAALRVITAGSSNGGSSSRRSTVAVQWGAYLCDGKLTGSITLLRPPRSS